MEENHQQAQRQMGNGPVLAADGRLRKACMYVFLVETLRRETHGSGLGNLGIGR